MKFKEMYFTEEKKDRTVGDHVAYKGRNYRISKINDDGTVDLLDRDAINKTKKSVLKGVDISGQTGQGSFLDKEDRKAEPKLGQRKQRAKKVKPDAEQTSLF